jgi:hypothetical protein
VIWLFVIFLFNVVIPTKKFPILGIPAGEFITCIIYAVFAAKVILFDPTKRFRTSLGKIWIVCLLVVAIAASRRFLDETDHTYWFWNMKQVFHYLFIFPLISLVHTKEQYEKCLTYYLVTALLAAGLLHLYAQFPQLVNWDVGTGFTMAVGDEVRIYTPGMMYVFLAAVGLIPFLRRDLRTLAVWLFLVSGLVHNYGRFYFLTLGICIALYLLYLRWVKVAGASKRTKAAGPVVGVLLALALVFLSVEFFPGGSVSLMVERMQTLAGFRAVPLREFDTLGWRIADAANAITQVQTPWEKVFGVFAKPYETQGTFDTGVHLGWVGLYFSYGLLGVLVFGTLSVLISVKVVRLLRTTKQRILSLPTEWAVAFGLVWVALCLFGFLGGMFVSGPSIIALTLLWYGVSLAEKPLSVDARRQKFRGIEWRTAQDLHRDPVLQPKSLHRGGPAQRKGAELPPGATHRR